MRRLLLTAALATVAVAGTFAPNADAAMTPSVLGISCSPQNGVQFCSSTPTTRVKSWDNVPLAVDVALPPPAQDGPFPTIVELHGWGFERQTVETAEMERLALKGYAVVRYDARGWYESCGTLVSRALPGCTPGYIHLADARYEARDTQYIAGLLADAGIAQPTKIGVTGASYGGGQSMILATLKDRIMLPDGSFAAWTSPNGTPMEIAAAAPVIPWSDLVSALVPNGRQLDYLPDSPYGDTVGVEKQSYVTTLFALGVPQYYSAPGADPEADVINWFALLSAGEPYDPVQTADLIDKIQRYHSAFYLQDSLPPEEREPPAPLLIYNAWTDDIFPNDESLRYANKVGSQFPGAEVSLFYADGFGHPRANLLATTTDLQNRTDEFWDRHLKGAAGTPLGIETFTQGCNGAPVEGPFITQTWDEQHPGEVRFDDAAAKSFDSTGGSPVTAQIVDPVSGLPPTSCRTAPGADDSNAANYRLPAATGTGYTLLGSPTVIARLQTSGDFPEVAARLWDVEPGGTETLVARSVYRPIEGTDELQVFQLHGNGWRFAAGHVAKLELLGRDSPYARASNGTFTVQASDLELRLPVREQPDGDQILPPEPPFIPGSSPGSASGSNPGPASGSTVSVTIGARRGCGRKHQKAHSKRCKKRRKH